MITIPQPSNTLKFFICHEYYPKVEVNTSSILHMMNTIAQLQ